MPFPGEVFLFGLLIVLAVLVARQKNLFAAAMLTGIFSLTSASLFTLMDAVDVAFTEAAVGAGFSTVLFLGTLALTSREERQQPPKLFPFIVVMLTGTALAMGIMSMRPYGDADAPIHTHVAAKIKHVEWAKLKHTTEKADPAKKAKKKPEDKAVGLPNLVTSILGSYRGYDTLGETGVIFTAGVGVMLLLLGRRRPEDEAVSASDDESGSEPPNGDAPDPAECELCGAEQVQRILSVSYASHGLVSQTPVYGAGANSSNVYGAACGTCGGVPNSCAEN